MSKLEKYQKDFDEAMENIKRIMTEESEIKEFANWVVNTESNEYSWLSERWAGSVSSAIGLDGLLSYIRYCLIDDGDITFVRMNKEPRIVFMAKDEITLDDVLHSTEKGLQKTYAGWGMNITYEFEILDIELKDFGRIYDEYFVDDIKRCFLSDAEINGADFAVKHYSSYKCYDPKWVNEIK